uniref:3-phosphoshikimate 1-carboxyvinyltransferase n=1 Tax=uncultured Flavonifractor sp. TaxID=1193534 RepID=UPI002623AE96|nr:3-phosphoshikimate 1-carboxyvinyltransferase [uncultured Flavonifractor sp.]
MNITITPALLAGAVTPPPSKSQAHRLIIAAALSDGFCKLSNVDLSEDIQATLRCMRTLDADASADGTIIRGCDLVDGHEEPAPEVMDCGESGSTLRFLIPVALALKGGGKFTGHGRLMERPQEPYFAMFREKGISYTLEDGVLTVAGKLAPGVYTLPGNVSSQFITGLLYALPLLEGDSEIRLTTELESRGYVDMTLDALKRFGVEAHFDGGRVFRVPGNQVYQHQDLAIEADWSNAAFWYGAVSLGCQVDIQGLNAYSVQGDMRIVPYFVKLQGEGQVDLDVSQCPDLVPPLAAMAALRAGETTRIVNAQRLRIKESDRLATVTEVLNALGADVEEHEDHLVIRGRAVLPGGVTVSGHNDHRIAMMAAIAAIRCEHPVTITGAECVKKSYPRFWEDYQALGGQITRNETKPGTEEL